MKIKIDKEADAAYILLDESKVKFKAKRTLPCEFISDGPQMFVDIDKDHQIIGLEIIGLKYLSESLKKVAVDYET